ncbi:MAG: hypothetical protein J7J75_03315 [Euryarchaeota archaeon]|nr:hypothetical protein [Euryarchaeota archaeon]MCD6158655.1 hypothetical protein [Euryarchaeota archaeon]
MKTAKDVINPVIVWSPVSDVAPHEWAEDGLWLFGSFNPLMYRSVPSVHSGAYIPLRAYLVSFDEIYERAERVVFPNFIEDRTEKFNKAYISRDMFTRVVRIWEAHEGIFAAKFDDIYVFKGISTEELSPAEISTIMSWNPISSELTELMNIFLESATMDQNIVEELQIYDITKDMNDIRTQSAKRYLEKLISYHESIREFLSTYTPRSIEREEDKTLFLKHDREIAAYITRTIMRYQERLRDQKVTMDVFIPELIHDTFSGNLEYFMGWMMRLFRSLVLLSKEIAKRYDIPNYKLAFLNMYSEIVKGNRPYKGLEKVIPEISPMEVGYIYGRILPVIYRDYLLKEYRDIVYWSREITAMLAIAHCLRVFDEKGFMAFEQEYEKLLRVLEAM